MHSDVFVNDDPYLFVPFGIKFWPPFEALFDKSTSELEVRIQRWCQAIIHNIESNDWFLPNGESNPSCVVQINPDISPRFTFGRVASYSIGIDGKLQSYGNRDQTGGAQERCDNRPIGGPPSLMRCFLSSYGGAPLGAQIGGVVILGLIAGIGIVTGIWGVGRYRRLLGGLSAGLALGLFLWWLSAA